MKYPKKFRIIATLKAPEDATAEDVKRIIRVMIYAMKIESVEEVDGD